MDEIAVKAVVIGVSIFVTLLIVTVVIFEFSEIKQLYKQTAETNITFEGRLDEFDKYRDSNTEFYGIDVQNTIDKYENDKSVDVCVSENCSDSIELTREEYSKPYISNLEQKNGIYIINFNRK